MTFWEVLFVPARACFFLEERRFLFFSFCLAAVLGLCVCVCGRVVCGCEVWE